MVFYFRQLKNLKIMTNFEKVSLVFDKKYQDCIFKIGTYLDRKGDYCGFEKYNTFVNWLINTEINEYRFLDRYIGYKANPFIFLELLQTSYHAFIDDGEISFCSYCVNGEIKDYYISFEDPCYDFWTKNQMLRFENRIKNELDINSRLCDFIEKQGLKTAKEVVRLDNYSFSFPFHRDVDKFISDIEKFIIDEKEYYKKLDQELKNEKI